MDGSYKGDFVNRDKMTSFMSLMDSLTTQQRLAVTSSQRFLQILAGPGSGKTLVLISRIIHILLKQNVLPQEIVVVTFTNKAAKEIKNRISSIIGEDIGNKIVSGTFHSFARQYLVKYGYLIGLGIFGIADRSDSIFLIKKYLKERNIVDLEILTNNTTIKLSPKSIMNLISSLKSKEITVSAYSDARKFPNSSKLLYHQEILNIYSYYQRSLLESNLLDFDDLLLHCLQLFKENPFCAKDIKYIFVDEYQDTNLIQYDMVKSLIHEKSSLTIVGDPDQSIYSFRSADITNFERMKEDFPDSGTVFLEHNFRSSGAILQTALALIEQDINRPEKTLYSSLKDGFTPVLKVLDDHVKEAQWIAKEIKKYVENTSGFLTYKDFSILVRSSVLTQPIENAFQKFAINYKMVGAYKFYDRQEIRDIIAYLRLICFNDELALSRIINIPNRGIGKNRWDFIVNKSKMNKKPILVILEEIAKGKHNTGKIIDKNVENSIISFINTINKIKNYINIQINSPISSILLYVCELLDYEKYLLKKYPDNFHERWNNVLQFINNFNNINSEDDNMYSHINETDNIYQKLLIKFLDNISLFSDTIENEDDTCLKVTISTIHAAKGLEWPIVFLPGLYNGSIPHSRAEDISEERRLLYVAITRAQAMLYLSYPGKNSFQDKLELSSFLKKISFVSSFEKQNPKLDIPFIKTLSELLKRSTPILNFSTINIYNNNLFIDNTFCNFYKEKNKNTAEIEHLEYSNDNMSISEGQLNPKYTGFINLKTVLNNQLNDYNQKQLSEEKNYNFKKHKTHQSVESTLKNETKHLNVSFKSQPKSVNKYINIQNLNIQKKASNNNDISLESQTQLAQSLKINKIAEKPIVKRLGIRRSILKRTMFYGK
ncbi:hypothetical protein T552_00247 [Pneumocystis carinii B80]|uniref:DNA 3'-5' helicase n=1 Tax=Pneumocystis carinii (strain B80) TaxID=1408658 RepID=A0A0W4ZTA6_PNEC8|nr:hypothetical protein T552_00247 [Pneumocystis carinii B80]KTW31609.1 hypothetical protein T552_00247 [Pneumocystis carinii B80]